MGKIRITLVDSGVRYDHPAFQGDKFQGFTYLGNNQISDDFCDTYGHGTAVYGIVRRAKELADIINIRVPGIEEGIDSEMLCSLLNYIADYVETDLVNLSLGVCVCDDLEKLYQACERLKQKNIVVFSAFDNAGAISYPAAFRNVIGVTTGERCRRADDFEYQQDEIVNLGGKGATQRLAWCMPDYLLLGGNSFACAHATAQAAIYMSEGCTSHEDLLKCFREHALVQRNSSKRVEKPRDIFKIESAALFPFCKEMHSLLRFSDLLNFHIADIYDIKYSAIVGASPRLLMKDENVPDIRIKNIDNIEWDKFDTLILGHMEELTALVNKQDFCKNLLKTAIQRGKKIVAFDDLTEELTPEELSVVYCPRVGKEHLPLNRFGKLYRFSKPIVGIFGTSSRQGKFTLQLILRRKLLQRGYQIGQLGTEPSSLLYGMDEVYPMGYNSSVYLSGFDAIRYLNDRINCICEKNVDIVLVGSQSGTVPYDTGNISQYMASQYDFLMGTLPDAVVLCVNPFDEWEYIERTVRFIESAVECKVIGLTLFPLDLKDEWKGIYGGNKIVDSSKIDSLKNVCKKQLGIPMFVLGEDKEMDYLTETIIEYFSEE